MRFINFLRSQYECLRFAAGLVGIMWILYAVSVVITLTQFGILPRQPFGLIGVFTSPFLHSNYQHLSANSVALFGFVWLLLSLSYKRGLVVLGCIWVISGVGTWLLGGKGEVHIGASGVIYGIFGYLLLVGAIERDLKSFLVSILVAGIYGSAIVGLIPTSEFISWESHLSGFLAGIIMAFAARRRRPGV